MTSETSHGPSEDWMDLPETAELIHDQHAVATAYDEMAAAINRDWAGTEPLVLPVMLGGLVPAGQLLPRLLFSLQLESIHATRYGGGTRGGELNWVARPRSSLKGRSVLLIDDILDEGLTLKALVKYCHEEGAARVGTAVLVRKKRDKAPAIEADYYGLEVPDRYVFGCGMDLYEYHRQLPAIYAI
ncbi:hypoxanthine-guanine phosphoribosyltransferase [Natronospira bacteriovora]|uniref:Hypoxanthine-guanine phosphoribosyltransferase n=1 Tax=Natronospira bacteriovora TaxID=3069753 RepID=A0ABU0W2N9_9GAMM|nr:hypoxanthine-guanine phosphoribosyltransferase [Natronospira sp. AB-CW4]MDQ2068272.1 hypoxanthine-guanine phosphoribosyltransferase [Natronospira sp. AB-CW4]